MWKRICPNCGKELFYSCECALNRALHRNNLCYWCAKKDSRTLSERFWCKVQKQTEGCWIWTANCNQKGYGLFIFNKRNYSSHRISWELHNGPIPKGMQVCHHCDNPPCVNPSHLFLGNPESNTHDAIQKDRLSKKIRNSDVKFIRQSSLPNSRLSTMFNTTSEYIHKIRCRKKRQFV